MSFAEFETIPARSLSPAQEKALVRKYLCGDCSGVRWTTIASLIAAGYLEQSGKALAVTALAVTELGAHYCFHHGRKVVI